MLCGDKRIVAVGDLDDLPGELAMDPESRAHSADGFGPGALLFDDPAVRITRQPDDLCHVVLELVYGGDLFCRFWLGGCVVLARNIQEAHPISSTVSET